MLFRKLCAEQKLGQGAYVMWLNVYMKLIFFCFCRKWHTAAAAYLRHALHVQLNEVSLVVLQDGQTHTEDDLEALREFKTLQNRPTCTL